MNHSSIPSVNVYWAPTVCKVKVRTISISLSNNSGRLIMLSSLKDSGGSYRQGCLQLENMQRPKWATTFWQHAAMPGLLQSFGISKTTGARKIGIPGDWTGRASVARILVLKVRVTGTEDRESEIISNLLQCQEVWPMFWGMGKLYGQMCVLQ